MVHGGVLLALTAQISCAQQTPASRKALDTLSAPFQFAYGTWEKRAAVQNGHIVLRGEGLTPKGGAGINFAADLSGNADLSPGLQVKIGTANTMRGLRLLLRDMDGHVGTWEYALPQPSANYATITPRDGASLAHPNALDKPDQLLDMKRLMQWQIIGDYSGDQAVDVEISALPLVAPDAALLAQRTAREKSQSEEQNKLRQAQDAQREKYKSGQPTSPVVTQAGLVAPDVLALTIEAGHVVPGSLTPYAPRPGDEKRAKDRQVILVRKGEEIGWLIGAQRDHLAAFEKLEGDPLLDFVADLPQTYSIASQDDTRFAASLAPASVWRKSKPTDWAQPGRGFAMRHVVYLRSPHPFSPGKTYTVQFPTLNTRKSELVFQCDPARVVSEAIHVQQIGFRPDDPTKRAFLSIWLGTGGAHHYAEGLRFSLREAGGGKSVYSGKVTPTKAAGEPEAMWKNQNFNGTDVCRLDFSDFTTPGTYRVCVEGIGCSEPFTIGNEVWMRAFQIQMAGLYNQRSGIALGPPYTSFRKPRDFHPADGLSVTQSTYSPLAKGGEAFSDLVKGDTRQPVPDAWGGYHDAGDWNPRRVTHMKVTHAQLELLELFPLDIRQSAPEHPSRRPHARHSHRSAV